MNPAVQQALALPRTFGFINAHDLEPSQQKIFNYVVQLAATTNTNIKDWELAAFESLDPSDKRAINKVFFEKQSSASTEPKVEIDLAKTIDTMKSRFDAIKQAELRRLEASRQAALGYCRSYYQSFEQELTKAHNDYLRIVQLKGQGAESLERPIQAILSSTFFTLARQEYNGWLYFHTPEIRLTEKNPRSGVNREVAMGRYLIELRAEVPSVKVFTRQHNIFSAGYYHPYVNTEGKICWGNAADTAAKLLSAMEFDKVFDLLAALLTTYSPDATPYRTLADFERISKAGGETICEHCDELDSNCECSFCDTCEQLSDECECHYCEACDQRYQEGDTCDGNYCTYCGECYGPDEMCDRHYCGICNEYSRDRDCACCGECGETNDSCERCRECDSHGGHDRSCSEHRNQEESGE